MSAYDPPIYIRVPPQAKPVGNTAVAAVLVFECAPEEIARVNEFIERLKDRGIVRTGHARAYNDTITSAELYFP